MLGVLTAMTGVGDPTAVVRCNQHRSGRCRLHVNIPANHALTPYCRSLALLPTRSEAQAHTTRGASGGATGAAAAAGAPASRLFAMDNFIDKTTAEGRFDFSEWVRAYGKYLDEQVRQRGLWALRKLLDCCRPCYVHAAWLELVFEPGSRLEVLGPHPLACPPQLSLYASLRWYVEQEAPGHESRMRSLGARDLLFQLPHLQRLQVQLTGLLW